MSRRSHIIAQHTCIISLEIWNILSENSQVIASKLYIEYCILEEESCHKGVEFQI